MCLILGYSPAKCHCPTGRWLIRELNQFVTDNAFDSDSTLSTATAEIIVQSNENEALQMHEKLQRGFVRNTFALLQLENCSALPYSRELLFYCTNQRKQQEKYLFSCKCIVFYSITNLTFSTLIFNQLISCLIFN